VRIASGGLSGSHPGAPSPAGDNPFLSRVLTSAFFKAKTANWFLSANLVLTLVHRHQSSLIWN
jgi:hypothetical protein